MIQVSEVQELELLNNLRCRWLAINPCKSQRLSTSLGHSATLCPARYEAWSRLGHLSAIVASAECPGAFDL